MAPALAVALAAGLTAGLAGTAAPAMDDGTAPAQGQGGAAAPPGEAAMGDEAGFRAWIEAFRARAAEAGIDPAFYDRVMAPLRFDPEIVRRDRTQTEFTRTIWVYLDSAVSEDRVARGRAALARHAPLLEAIEARWGVRKEIVLAVWGLESAYGAVRGDTPVLEALATLAYDGRRAAFFEAELLAGLDILQAGQVAPGAFRGSWAGASGHTQFMPSSWQRVAVDFDGDGRRDLWSDDPADALASTAAYLAAAGWWPGQPWGYEVRLPEGFDYRLSGERVTKDVAEWGALGLTAADGGPLAGAGPASVRLPGGARGAAFLTFPNFAAIERYNPADAYVIAVGHLADRIAGGPPVAAPWPREDRALTGDERRELQARLAAAGFDPGGVDGRIGPNTIAAIQAYQAAQGLIPDGYANPALLERLR